MKVHEAVLYAGDVPAATRFYAELLGLRVVFQRGALMSALRVDADAVVLLFDPDESAVAGRDVPSHGAHGAGHVAFRVDGTEHDEIRRRLERAGVEIERELTWPRGGRSTYFRDPAGNSVELVVGEIWPA